MLRAGRCGSLVRCHAAKSSDSACQHAESGHGSADATYVDPVSAAVRRDHQALDLDVGCTFRVSIAGDGEPYSCWAPVLVISMTSLGPVQSKGGGTQRERGRRRIVSSRGLRYFAARHI